MTTQGAPGGLVCVNKECAVAGYPTTREACVKCGMPTRDRQEPGLDVPATRPQGPSQLDTLNKGVDVGSRVIYGGFWVLVAVVGVLVGLVLLSQGNAAGLVTILIGVVAALYARYIIRGGRFRIMFW